MCFKKEQEQKAHLANLIDADEELEDSKEPKDIAAYLVEENLDCNIKDLWTILCFSLRWYSALSSPQK